MPFTVLAVIASLKVAVTAVAVLTPVAPFGGVNALTAGAVVSVPVVLKNQTKSAASGFPARSVAPVEPPRTVAV